MTASSFLDRFRTAENAGNPLSAFVDDPDGFGAALAEKAEALGVAIEAAVGTTYGPPVSVNADCFASAACDSHGGLVVHGDRFADWFEGIDPLSAAVRGIGPGNPRVSLFADDRTGRPVALAAGTVAVARLWPLDPVVRRALDTGQASHAVVAFRPGDGSWQQAAGAFSLTAAEAGLVAALGRYGDLQRAARERGVAYETARKFVASAMRKTGAKRQTELVWNTLSAAAGDIIRTTSLVQLARDLFALTERQAQLALLVAGGATREEAASALGLSEHRAKSDLKAVFQACGVASAVDLARIIAEINALEGLAKACEVTIVGRGRTSEPLRLVPRSWAAGRVAVADHGPPGAQPVLIFHSNVSGRHHPQRFISALRAAGFRPIAIERAGYGLTDAAEGNLVEAAVRDLHDVLDALGIDRAPVIARCNTASVVACAAAATGRVTGGVLLWPEAPRASDRPETRMTDRIRAVFVRYPALAHGFARLASRRTSAAAIERLWRKSCEGIGMDMALLDDPQELADIIRGGQQASLGMTGFMDEALELGDGPRPQRIDDARAWTVMFGGGYERYDISDATAWWTGHLPGATIEVVEGGVHFLHSTHTAEVIAALQRSLTAEGRVRKAA
jgi:pimeloyl-ACP methyl ester carboxylesterase/DNA-binding CsgD family transcriptional regulator